MYWFPKLHLGPYETQSTQSPGPVVQNIVFLTTSLRRQRVKYMPTNYANTVIFVGTM